MIGVLVEISEVGDERCEDRHQAQEKEKGQTHHRESVALQSVTAFGIHPSHAVAFLK